jgi:hypothetical protein
MAGCIERNSFDKLTSMVADVVKEDCVEMVDY